MIWLTVTTILVVLFRFSVLTPHDIVLGWPRTYEAIAHLWAGYLLAIVFYRTSVQSKPTQPEIKWAAAGAVFLATLLEVILWAVR